MIATALSVRDFRSYEAAEVRLGAGLTVISGRNGAGKTNLLEAVYFACTGRSCRTANEREVVRFGAELTRLELICEDELGRHDISVGFKPGEDNAGVRILMSGNDVFKHAVKALDSVVEEALESNGLDRHEIDWLIPHQANLRIIEATAKRLDMPMDRVVVTVDRHGNTSSGSVPLALDEAVRSGKVQRGQLVLLEAFGGGFTWGSALLRY